MGCSLSFQVHRHLDHHEQWGDDRLPAIRVEESRHLAGGTIGYADGLSLAAVAIRPSVFTTTTPLKASRPPRTAVAPGASCNHAQPDRKAMTGTAYIRLAARPAGRRLSTICLLYTSPSPRD